MATSTQQQGGLQEKVSAYIWEKEAFQLKELKLPRALLLAKALFQ